MEFTGHRWIPLTKVQWRGICFHLMTSSFTEHITFLAVSKSPSLRLNLRFWIIESTCHHMKCKRTNYHTGSILVLNHETGVVARHLRSILVRTFSRTFCNCSAGERPQRPLVLTNIIWANIRIWAGLRNCIDINRVDVITHPWPNFNGSLLYRSGGCQATARWRLTKSGEIVHLRHQNSFLLQWADERTL